MDRIFKTHLLSLVWQLGLLALNIIPILILQKYAQYKTFEQLPLYSAKATNTWLLRIRNSRQANV